MTEVVPAGYHGAAVLVQVIVPLPLIHAYQMSPLLHLLICQICQIYVYLHRWDVAKLSTCYRFGMLDHCTILTAMTACMPSGLRVDGWMSVCSKPCTGRRAITDDESRGAACCLAIACLQNNVLMVPRS